MKRIGIMAVLGLAWASFGAEPAAGVVQESETGIRHRFLVCGAETYIVEKDCSVSWKYPRGTRDGWVLPSGNALLSVTKCKEYPSGAIVEADKDGKTVFEFKGTQSEVDAVQALENGNVLLTESGAKPRLLEVSREGKIVLEVPLKCQTGNAHMETRMARKLAGGTYLVPHLLDKVVREYKADGTVVSEIKTADEPKESWPFTAIRLANGNTLIDCTHGNTVMEADAKGATVWLLTNKDLPAPLLSDPCGAQRLSNGNTVITSYGASAAGAVKMLEVTPEKKVVWTFKSGKNHGVHEFQILDDAAALK